jgi:chemotaxis protein methyltransferase CheR
MLIRRHFPELLGWKLRILATDISETMLERCRQGLYSAVEIGRGLEPELLRTYFKEQEGGWRLDAGIRSMVELRRQNLTHSLGSLGSFDLVLLRTVLIYFDDASKLDILRRVRQIMHPGGVLLLGSTEMTNAPEWERCVEGDCRFLRKVA